MVAEFPPASLADEACLALERLCERLERVLDVPPEDEPSTRPLLQLVEAA